MLSTYAEIKQASGSCDVKNTDLNNAHNIKLKLILTKQYYQKVPENVKFIV